MWPSTLVALVSMGCLVNVGYCLCKCLRPAEPGSLGNLRRSSKQGSPEPQKDLNSMVGLIKMEELINTRGLVSLRDLESLVGPIAQEAWKIWEA